MKVEPQEQLRMIKRGAVEVIREDELLRKLKKGKPLRVKAGFDPTAPDLHLGHTVLIQKMKQFQELGHEVIFLIGNYTSLIGDPSDQDRLRPQLTADQVAANGRTYAEQAYKVLDAKKTQVKHNAAWLSELSFAELIRLASNFTVQQFLARENFAKRLEKGDPIYLHETFYSLMQGYDAYALDCDVQVGGSDQLFNIVTAARKLMAFMGRKPDIGVILDILPGTDGEIKMSKSLGNHIPLLATAEDMYGKVMSVPDKAMPYFFRLVTRWKPDEIATIESGLASGELHPRNVKMQLAHELVSIYHNPAEADRAQDEFVRVFQKGDLPEEMETFKMTEGMTVLEVLAASGLVASNAEGRRLVNQNAVRFEGETLTDPFAPLQGEGVLQVGKRKFVRILV